MTACIYCGGEGNQSRDHVPPKASFPKPRPSDLITVPSCEKCNRGFQQDDEYFKAHLGIRADIEGAPRAETLTEEVLRSWQRPQSGGFTAAFRDSFATRTIRAPDHSVIGQEFGHVALTERINRVLERTVRGLFFHETGTVLPLDYRVRARMWEVLPPQDARSYMALMGGAPLRVIANGAFRYAARIAGDDPFASAWLLQFYGSATFLGVTAH